VNFVLNIYFFPCRQSVTCVLLLGVHDGVTINYSHEVHFLQHCWLAMYGGSALCIMFLTNARNMPWKSRIPSEIFLANYCLLRQVWIYMYSAQHKRSTCPEFAHVFYSFQQLRRLVAFVLSHVPFIYYLWCIRLVFDIKCICTFRGSLMWTWHFSVFDLEIVLVK
jgi:hypothetical protein